MSYRHTAARIQKIVNAPKSLVALQSVNAHRSPLITHTVTTIARFPTSHACIRGGVWPTTSRCWNRPRYITHRAAKKFDILLAGAILLWDKFSRGCDHTAFQSIRPPTQCPQRSCQFGALPGSGLATKLERVRKDTRRCSV